MARCSTHNNLSIPPLFAQRAAFERRQFYDINWSAIWITIFRFICQFAGTIHKVLHRLVLARHGVRGGGTLWVCPPWSVQQERWYSAPMCRCSVLISEGWVVRKYIQAIYFQEIDTHDQHCRNKKNRPRPLEPTTVVYEERYSTTILFTDSFLAITFITSLGSFFSLSFFIYFTHVRFAKSLFFLFVY